MNILTLPFEKNVQLRSFPTKSINTDMWSQFLNEGNQNPLELLPQEEFPRVIELPSQSYNPLMGKNNRRGIEELIESISKSPTGCVKSPKMIKISSPNMRKLTRNNDLLKNIFGNNEIEVGLTKDQTKRERKKLNKQSKKRKKMKGKQAKKKLMLEKERIKKKKKKNTKNTKRRKKR